MPGLARQRSPAHRPNLRINRRNSKVIPADPSVTRNLNVAKLIVAAPSADAANGPPIYCNSNSAPLGSRYSLSPFIKAQQGGRPQMLSIKRTTIVNKANTFPVLMRHKRRKAASKRQSQIRSDVLAALGFSRRLRLSRPAVRGHRWQPQAKWSRACSTAYADRAGQLYRGRDASEPRRELIQDC